MDRKDIQIISQHSNWSEEGVDQALEEHVYPDATAWKKFLELMFISLGVGFTVSGIIFFFAYNWADLNKFVKMGLVEGLIVIATGLVLFSKLNLQTKKIILTGCAVLVGVLFAVFGQIYQTGANAYDFFLGWTIFITIWVLVSDFPPLWLIYILLINTTMILYAKQVANDWSFVYLQTILFILNTVFAVSFHLLSKFKDHFLIPSWFTAILGLASVSYATIGITISIFDDKSASFFTLIFLTMIAYGAGILYSLKTKNVFYLTIIPFSVICIITAFLLEISFDASMLFVVSIFIIASVTATIIGVLNIQKKWRNG
uniref:DUF2157 domain-containing protein n=1 Tax=Flavobacterium sp. TaxID=239 RepID=UPI00404A5359